jgi:hypothetical protein
VAQAKLGESCAIGMGDIGRPLSLITALICTSRSANQLTARRRKSIALLTLGVGKGKGGVVVDHHVHVLKRARPRLTPSTRVLIWLLR